MNNAERYRELCEEPLCTEDLNRYGYLLWALWGFEITEENELTQFYELIKTSDNEVVRNAKTLGELLQTLDGRRYWAENGFSFQGTFDLKDNLRTKRLKESTQNRAEIMEYRNQVGLTLSLLENILSALEDRILIVAQSGIHKEWAKQAEQDVRVGIHTNWLKTEDKGLECLRDAWLSVAGAFIELRDNTSPPINFGKQDSGEQPEIV